MLAVSEIPIIPLASIFNPLVRSKQYFSSFPGVGVAKDPKDSPPVMAAHLNDLTD